MKRRDALKVLGTTVAGASVAGLALAVEDTVSQRLPAIYLPHGGGPWPFVKLGFAPETETAPLRSYLEQLPTTLKTPPRAVLVVSAHWERPVPTVMTSAHPPMLYDYSGFPPESYQIQWPAPGAPELAARVQSLLRASGFETAEDADRGFDHGTFVPLKLSFPNPKIPTTQLSLIQGLDPAQHLAMGRALAPLRDEGVLIVGSGMSYHNLRGFVGEAGNKVAEEFGEWLDQAATAPAERREELLKAWAQAPSARSAHPREEHLLPLMVVAAAAGDDAAKVAFSGLFSGKRISAIHYG